MKISSNHSKIVAAAMLGVFLQANASAQQAVPLGTSGKLELQRWNNIQGAGLIQLTSAPQFYIAPSSTSLSDASYQSLGDNYGTRLRGYVTAPATGLYTFWVAGDDQVQLSVSPSGLKYHAKKIAANSSATGLNEFDWQSGQRSSPVFLKAGVPCFIEALHKEATQSDSLAISWAVQKVDVSAPEQNWASSQNGAIASSSTNTGANGIASNGIDGNSSSFFSTTGDMNGWWAVDFRDSRHISRVEFVNRQDSGQNRASNFCAELLGSNGEVVASKNFYQTTGAMAATESWVLDREVAAQRLRIRSLGLNRENTFVLHFAEVQAYGRDTVYKNWSRQPGVSAVQSSAYDSSYKASSLIDGNISTFNHTQNLSNSFVTVDLGTERLLDVIELVNRQNGGQERLSNFRVSLLDASNAVAFSQDFYTTSGNARNMHRMDLVNPILTKTIKIEFLGLNRQGNGYLHLAEICAFGRVDSADSERGLRQVLPASVLNAYTAAGTSDADDDNFPDAWEQQFGLSPGYETGANAAFADPDLDGRNNLTESVDGTNPFVAQGVSGFLMRHSWLNLPYYSLLQTRQSTRYIQAADQVAYHDQSIVITPNTYSAGRVRGTITPPESNYYRFWIASGEASELWLSTVGGNKYHKEKLCAMSPELGTGHGISPSSPFLWDTFSQQMSREVWLEAGQSYYLEADYQFGHSSYNHVSIAWAKRGGARAPIPNSYLNSYFVSPEDADDDCLPDAWELQHGLSITDAGGTDLQKQGEFGDFDGDSLNNREEYVLGTNPANTDSDGDGASDLDEVKYYKTSPTQSNAISGDLVSSPALTTYNVAATSANWQMLDGGLLGDSFRGKIEWNFSVPSDGWWIVDLAARLRGTVRNAEEIDLGMKINGKSLAPQAMHFLHGKPSNLKILTPYLTAGTHRFEIDIRNEIGRRSLQILGLKVLGAGGFDGDANGRPDWVDALLADANNVVPFANESVVSPAFIEGSVRYLNGLQATAAGQSLQVQRGLGDLHWYANVPLQPENATAVALNFEDRNHSQSVSWVRWNALGGTPLTIRAGDSVKIGAWLSLPDSAAVSIQVAGQTHAITANSYAVRTFSQAGVYPVTVSHNGIPKAAATITVMSANFGDTQLFYADTVTRRIYSQIAPSLLITAEPSLKVEASQVQGSGQSVAYRALRSGVHKVAARLPGSNAVVAFGNVTTVGFSDALRHDAAVYVGSTVDGYRILRTPVLVTDLPAGGRVVISIFRAGVTFMDGTTTKTLTAESFINGVAYLDFRYPPNMSGGYCHYTEVFDAKNRSLGRR